MSPTESDVVAPVASENGVRPRAFPWWLAVLAIVLAFTFLGSRPIWDPDEGRYSNVALHMLESGDWVRPMRNHEQGHWTKPPVTYWAVAAAVGAIGYTPWAARLPVALAYLACVWLVWRMARRLAPGRETLAGLAFATMGLPLAASQVLTTDFLLTALLALAMFGFVEARYGPSTARRRWLSLMWLGFALAFLTKGPPALLPLAAVLAFNVLTPKAQRLPLFQFPGPWLFLLVGLSWYVAVVLIQPGLLAYFLGSEVVERVAGHGFHRNSQWYGWLAVYLPTLLLGSLPWTGRLWRWLRGLPPILRAWWHHRAAEHSPTMLLVFWIALPLAVFCLAQSRLPLYVLPLFVPMALAIATVSERPPATRWLVLIIVLAIGLRIAALWMPTHKSSEQWAEQIRQRFDYPVAEVVFIDDMARYGIHLHLGAEVEKVTMAEVGPVLPIGDERGHGLVTELRERDPRVVYITKQTQFADVQAVLAAEGLQAQVHGEPFWGRVFFTVDTPAVVRGEL